MTNEQLSIQAIGQKIYLIRGHRVMLDGDLAELYGVETKALKRAVRRNIHRFPRDFMFEITEKELENLRYQFGTSSLGESSSYGGVRYLPFVFTEHGVAMLSSVLNSDRAVAVNIEIIRTFIDLREQLDLKNEFAKKFDLLENKFTQVDQKFVSVFEAIRQLVQVGSPPLRKKIRTLDEK